MPVEPIATDGAVMAAEATLGADGLLVDGDVVMVYVREACQRSRQQRR
jgi:hypothetical protein